MSAPLYSSVGYWTASAATVPDSWTTLATTLVKGEKGDTGAAGADGADGGNAYTATTGDFVQPAVDGTVLVSVGSSAWMGVNQLIYVVGGGHYYVVNLPNATSATLYNLGYDDNAAPADTVSLGARVSPDGIQGADGTDAGAGTVYFSDVDPNGVISAERPAMCYSSNGRQWTKTNAGENTAGWVEVLSGGLFYGTEVERLAATPPGPAAWISSDSVPPHQIFVWTGAAWT